MKNVLIGANRMAHFIHKAFYLMSKQKKKMLTIEVFGDRTKQQQPKLIYTHLHLQNYTEINVNNFF